MANLSLLDAFGLDASGSLKPDATLAQAFPQFLHLRNTPLDQVQLAAGKANLTISQPIPLLIPGLSLIIGVGAGGHIQILTTADHILDSNDPFSAINIAASEIYIGLALQLSTAGGTNLSTGSVAFGLALERGLSVTVYRRFTQPANGVFPSFSAALAQTFSSFVVPQSPADLDSLHRDTVLVIAGEGKLDLSASFGIELPVQQLAAKSPVAGQLVPVNLGASLTAGFGVTFAGGYQSRLRRLENEAIEIGIYKSQSRTLAVQVSAEAGVPATVGKFDLAEKFISSLSPKPSIDLQEFRQALPGEDAIARDLQIASFQDDLGSAISTNVEANLTAGFSNLQNDETALSFEVSPGAVNTGAASSALIAALKGNFKALTSTSTALPAGVRQTANICTKTALAKHKLTVNLLGIVNFVSIGKLARISEVKRNANGEITCITDTSDAKRLQAVLLNVAGSAKRLQSMLSEDFLFQSTFKTTGLSVLPADFSAKHTFFETNNKTGRHRMKELLDICCTLGLLTKDGESARLPGKGDFGRTTFWLQTTYSEASIERAFLRADGAARAEEEFETIGRQSLSLLLAGEEDQEFRKQLADLGPKGTSLWQEMKKIGNTADFNRLFGLPLDIPDPRVQAAAADFLCIVSWAGAMKQLGEIIVEIRALVSTIVNVNDDRLTALRKLLRDRMAEVVKHSGEHFGEPLGLVMVYRASQQSAGARVIATGSSIPPLNNVIGPKVS